MADFTVKTWAGLDRRPRASTDDNNILYVGDNLTIDVGGQISLRPAMVKVADLWSESAGLYQRGGRLHAAVPGGHARSNVVSDITYDPIGVAIGLTPAARSLGTVIDVVAAETYGVSGTYGPYGYVVVLNDKGLYEHHWLRDPVTPDTTAVATQVQLPHSPAPGLVKLATKLWSVDNTTGSIRFSSSVNGPSDWAEPDDAGAIQVSQHASASSRIIGLAPFRGRLAVFFEDSVQLWQVDVNPERISLEQVLNGPGTLLPQSAVNVLGDVFFLSRGGFRTLSTATVTGEANDTDVGSFLYDYTQGITGTETCTALWSQTRSQYLCAIGTSLYAFTFSPANQVRAWTRWVLPVAVEHLAEAGGVLYARAGDALYKFDPDQYVDYNGSAVVGSLETDTWGLDAPGRRKQFKWLAVRQTVAARWSLVVDGVERASQLVAGGNIPARVPLAAIGRQVALRCRPTGAWRLEGLQLTYDRLGS